MLIAWQTLNAARTRNSTRFTDAFLIVAPGLTVRDRLRVLHPSDPSNIYTALDIVPRELRDDLQRARIIITNFHAFKKRETLEAPKLAKEILAGRKGKTERPETDGQMAQRICKDLLGRKRIIVINDEAYHCYRQKVGAADDAGAKLDAECKAEAKKNNAAARLWISGIEALQRVVGQPVLVYDLSATPFFLRGSGYPEGTLFPWVVSDFSLIDAIACGIVKVPRVPVQDLPGAVEPVYRHVYRYIQEHSDVKLPKAGRSKQGKQLTPDQLPSQLTGALQALYGLTVRSSRTGRSAAAARRSSSSLCAITPPPRSSCTIGSPAMSASRPTQRAPSAALSCPATFRSSPTSPRPASARAAWSSARSPS